MRLERACLLWRERRRLTACALMQGKVSSLRGLKNSILNKSKGENAPRAANAWGAIEAHTHRTSEMYIALADRINRDVVGPMRTTMEAGWFQSLPRVLTLVFLR